MGKLEETLVNWKIDGELMRVSGDAPNGKYIINVDILDIDRREPDIVVETLSAKYKLKRGRGLVGGVGDGFIL